MSHFTKKQVIEKITGLTTISIAKNDIVNVNEQAGGLLNYVFRVETKKGLFFLKQFLQELKHKAFRDIETDCKDRLKLAYEAMVIFAEKSNGQRNIISHVFEYNLNEGYLIIEGFDNVLPLFDRIKVADFTNNCLRGVAKSIAQVHQGTYEVENKNFNLYNNFLDLKLKYQYYKMAEMIEEKSCSKVLKEFADRYKSKRHCLVHGDLHSRNIFIVDGEKGFNIIDFEDAHIGHPSFDLGYILSEYFIARSYFNKNKEVNKVMKDFLEEYFKYFTKEDRVSVEKEVTLHTASLIMFRLFGLSKDSFTAYIDNNEVKEKLKAYVINMIKLSDNPISKFI
jgi:thiamine kinase-like enzyme